MKKIKISILMLLCTILFSGCSMQKMIDDVRLHIHIGNEKPVIEEQDIPRKIEGCYKIINYETKLEEVFLGVNVREYLTVENIKTSDQFTFEFSRTDIDHYFIGFPDDTYLLLTHEGDEILAWDIIDIETMDSVKHLDSKEFIFKYNTNPEIFPEGNDGQEIDAPDIIYLSELKEKHSYTFRLKEDSSRYVLPQIINDTDAHIAATYLKTPHYNYNEEDKEFHTNKRIDGYYSATTSAGPIINFCWIEDDVESIKNSVEYIALSNYDYDTPIKLWTKRLLHNDTDNTLLIMSKEGNIELSPGEIGDIIWTVETITMIKVN